MRESDWGEELALLALIILILSFIIIQMQFRFWEKRMIVLESVGTSNTREIITPKYYLDEHDHLTIINHRHRYHDGLVDLNEKGEIQWRSK